MQQQLRSPSIAPAPIVASQIRSQHSTNSTACPRQNLRLQTPELQSISPSQVRSSPTVCTRALDTRVEEAQPEAAPPSNGKDQSEAGGEYEISVKKPLGFQLARGIDGGAYVQRSDPSTGNTDDRIQPGDKVLAVSASFGSDVWDCKGYGQALYAIKTRNGEVYVKFQSRGGDLSVFDDSQLDKDQSKYWSERDGGNYGLSTKQWQAKNYKQRKELEEKRVALFEAALGKFKKGDIEGALIDFEEVISMEPKNYMGEDLSKVTQIFRVTQYNIACCYSAIDQVDAGLDALQAALKAGFEQYGKIRTDPNLEKVRTSPRFEPMVDQYDEPVISRGAISAIKSLFSFGGKS